MLIDWNDVEATERAPGVWQRQVELDNLFVSLQEIRAPDADRPMKTHSHPHRQAGYVIEGEFDVLIGDEIHTIHSGEAYMIPPNVIHGARAHVPVVLLNFYVAPGPDHVEEYRAKNSTRKDKAP